MTSSKISTAPCFVHTSRRASRNPGTGGMQFMLPATGSTMTHATSAPIAPKSWRTWPMSLYESVSVCAASSGGTPGEVGTPSVSMPEPAFTSSESEWPW